MKAFFIISTLVFIMLLPGCSKDEYPVPNVSFTAYIDIHLPDYAGSVFTVSRDRYGNQIGVSGIIVYRLSNVEYFAFERYCPHDQKLTCKVVLDEGKSTATCNCCESEFLILSATADVVSGPSKLGLKNYRTRIDGPYLVVSN